MNHNTISLFVGLDYHMNSVQVCVMDERGTILVNRICANDWQAIVRTVAHHGSMVQAAIVNRWMRGLFHTLKEMPTQTMAGAA